MQNDRLHWKQAEKNTLEGKAGKIQIMSVVQLKCCITVNYFLVLTNAS